MSRPKVSEAKSCQNKVLQFTRITDITHNHIHPHHPTTAAGGSANLSGLCLTFQAEQPQQEATRVPVTRGQSEMMPST